MARLISRRALGVLASALCASCALFGGQTGQDSAPASEPPPCPRTVVANQVWNGTTVEARVQPLVGTYAAELTWWTEPPGGAQSSALALEDRLSIVVAYSGVGGTVTCAGSLEVPVEVTLSSEVSGISEQGAGTLTFAASADPGAQLSHSMGGLTLSVRLNPIATQMPPAGDLTATRDELPSSYATIGEAP